MPFNQKPQKFNASINTVEIGCGDKAIKLEENARFLSIHLTLPWKMHQRSV